jgi:hypothetical protein
MTKRGPRQFPVMRAVFSRKETAEFPSKKTRLLFFNSGAACGAVRSPVVERLDWRHLLNSTSR